MLDLIGEFVSFMIEITFWYFVCSFIIDYFMDRPSSKRIAKLEKEVQDKVESLVHQVKMEKHGDIHYWFDQDNDEFLAQGKTTEELVNALKYRFPDHIFLLNNNKMLAGPDFAIVETNEEILGEILNKNKKLLRILGR